MSGMIGKLAVVLLLSTTSVVAQIATRAEPRTDGQVMDFWVTNTEQLLLSAAEAMPEKKYSFALSNGKFWGVRTFAEQVKDLAAANYQLATATLDEEPPVGTDRETAPDSVKTKAQVLDYLKGSFTTLHRATMALNEKHGGSDLDQGQQNAPSDAHRHPSPLVQPLRSVSRVSKDEQHRSTCDSLKISLEQFRKGE